MERCDVCKGGSEKIPCRCYWVAKPVPTAPCPACEVEMVAEVIGIHRSLAHRHS